MTASLQEQLHFYRILKYYLYHLYGVTSFTCRRPQVNVKVVMKLQFTAALKLQLPLQLQLQNEGHSSIRFLEMKMLSLD